MDETKELLLSWKVSVQNEMNRLTADPQSTQQLFDKELINNAWRKNRQLLNSQQSEPSSNCCIFKDQFPSPTSSVPGKPRAKLCVPFKSKAKKIVSEVAILTIPEVEPAPSQTMWIPIQRNLLPDKDAPTNIPYFGDEVIEKDKKFIATLVEEVNHQITEEMLTDSVFTNLINSLNVKNEEDSSQSTSLFPPKTKTETQFYQETLKNPQLPRLIVFQAISVSYPELGSPDDLIRRFKRMKKRSESTEYAPNIDGEEAADLSAEETLHTYRSLLCRRCFLYDCPLHRDDPVIEDPLPPRPGTRDLPLGTEPCSSRCYLNHPGKSLLLSPRTPKNERIKQREKTYMDEYSEERAHCFAQLLNPSNTESEEWRPEEKSLYRVLIKSFPGNFCAVAQALCTKKCEDVFHFSVEEGKTSRGEKKGNSKAKKFGKTQQAQLYKHTQDGKKENKRPYVPCHHPGKDCHPDVCTCRMNNNFCEKFCYCSVDCRDRFPGCRCKSNCKTRKCPCFLASRECDPDLCESCLDGKLELSPETNSCQNVYLQRLMGKKLYVAKSEIAGMGCFIGETAEENDFIAEYVGEMITHEECESRGLVYDKAKSSYMFNLNEEYIVDAARFGGNIRFANHSSKPNCQVKILLVNGDYRIGIYAKQSIQLGEELFFDYGKDFVGHDLKE